MGNVIGLYTCSCHLFESYEQADAAAKQKLEVGEKVKERCSGEEGEVSEVNKGGYVIVKYGERPCDHKLEHAQELIKITPLFN